jgi:hypothetical protein
MDDLTNGTSSAPVETPSSDGAALQSSMTGDFFYDEGSDAVVDANGNAQKNPAGETFRNMDDFAKHRAQKGGDPTQPQGGQTQQGNLLKTPVQPNAFGFDSVYNKNGKFDFDTITKQIGNSGKVAYQMQSVFKPVAPNPVQPTAPVVPIDPKERVRTAIQEHRKTLESTKLDPIRRAYQNVSAAYAKTGQSVPEDIYRAINAVYVEKERELVEELDKKRDEIYADQISNMETEKEVIAAKRISSSNFKETADQFLPHVAPAQRSEKLTELIFGHHDAKGIFQRGYGADAVEHAFDLSMGNKTFNSPDEWSQAYNNWWLKYSSNPSNIAYITNVAFSRYVAANQSKFRDEYRRAWDAEAEAKLRNRNSIPRSTGAIPVETANEDQSLIDYHTAPRRNLG